MELRRVAITGINSISGIGNNIDEMWQNLLNGKTGIEKFDLCGDPDMAHFAARVKNLSFSEEFFDHKETPGLGGEIDNPKWKATWKGKEVYSDSGDVLISVIKGSVDRSSSQAKYQVDGLSGATITSNGVTNLLSFWLGDMGYGPLINTLKEQGSKDV